MFHELMKWMLDYYELYMHCIMSVIGMLWNLSIIIAPANLRKGTALALTSCAFSMGVVLSLSYLIRKWNMKHQVSTYDNILRICIYPFQIICMAFVSYWLLSLYWLLFLIGEEADAWSWMYIWKSTDALTEQEPTLIGYFIALALFCNGLAKTSFAEFFIREIQMWLLMKFKRPAPIDLVFNRGRYFDPVELALHVQT